MKPTYLFIPDFPDTAPRPCNIEDEQEENMIAIIGLEMFGWLTEMECKNAPLP